MESSLVDKNYFLLYHIYMTTIHGINNFCKPVVWAEGVMAQAPAIACSERFFAYVRGGAEGYRVSSFDAKTRQFSVIPTEMKEISRSCFACWAARLSCLFLVPPLFCFCVKLYFRVRYTGSEVPLASMRLESSPPTKPARVSLDVLLDGKENQVGYTPAQGFRVEAQLRPKFFRIHPEASEEDFRRYQLHEEARHALMLYLDEGSAARYKPEIILGVWEEDKPLPSIEEICRHLDPYYIDHPDEQGLTLLHYAHLLQDTRLIEQLQKHGADPRVHSSAVTSGSLEFQGKDREKQGLEIRLGAGFTPVNLARNFEQQVLRNSYLLCLAHNLEESSFQVRFCVMWSPLHRLKKLTIPLKTRECMVREMTDLNWKNSDGCTLLHYAHLYENEVCVQELMATGRCREEASEISFGYHEGLYSQQQIGQYKKTLTPQEMRTQLVPSLLLHQLLRSKLSNIPLLPISLCPSLEVHNSLIHLKWKEWEKLPEERIKHIKDLLDVPLQELGFEEYQGNELTGVQYFIIQMQKIMSPALTQNPYNHYALASLCKYLLIIKEIVSLSALQDLFSPEFQRKLPTPLSEGFYEHPLLNPLYKDWQTRSQQHYAAIETIPMESGEVRLTDIPTALIGEYLGLSPFKKNAVSY